MSENSEENNERKNSGPSLMRMVAGILGTPRTTEKVDRATGEKAYVHEWEPPARDLDAEELQEVNAVANRIIALEAEYHRLTEELERKDAEIERLNQNHAAAEAEIQKTINFYGRMLRPEAREGLELCMKKLRARG